VSAESTLYPRHLTVEVHEALASSRVVNLVGPRQAGKTTLVRSLLGEGRFVTLDDRSTLEAFDRDAGGQLALLRRETGDAPLIIDEIQRLKSLALEIKLIVDADRRRGQFLLTGSSNVFTTLEATDSLAGRMSTLKLWPLSVAEIERRAPCFLLDWAAGDELDLPASPAAPDWSRDRYIELMVRGGYPEIRDLRDRTRARRYEDYIDAVVDRDVADVLRIRKGDALRRLIDQLAARTSFELNLSELSSVIGIQRPTLETYLDVLTRLSLVVRQPAWTASESRRDIRNAKYHFVDTGIATALRGLSSDSFGSQADPTSLGAVLETWVFGELTRAAALQHNRFRLYHWRDRDGREVDIVAEGGGSLVAIEIKAAASVSARDFRHLDWFAARGPGKGRRVTGIVLYLGKEKLSFGKRTFALPVSVLSGSEGVSGF